MKKLLIILIIVASSCNKENNNKLDFVKLENLYKNDDLRLNSLLFIKKNYENKYSLYKGRLKYDSAILNNKFVTDWIDYTIKTRKKFKFEKFKQNEFIKYFMPYRLNYESIFNWKKEVELKFPEIKKIYDSSKNIHEFIRKTNGYIADEFKLGSSGIIAPTIEDLLNKKKAICDNIGRLMIYILRTYGIPSGLDFVRFKSKSDEIGHVWCYYIYNNKYYYFNPLSKEDEYFTFKYYNSPKIYRYDFKSKNENSIEDITNHYYKTGSIEIPWNMFSREEEVGLKVFYKSKWETICTSKEKEFNNIGKDNIYYISQNEKNYIIHLDSLGEINNINYKNGDKIKRKKITLININEAYLKMLSLYKKTKLSTNKRKTKILDFLNKNAEKIKYFLCSFKLKGKLTLYSINSNSKLIFISEVKTKKLKDRKEYIINSLIEDRILIIKDNENNLSRPFIYKNNNIYFY